MAPTGNTDVILPEEEQLLNGNNSDVFMEEDDVKKQGNTGYLYRNQINGEGNLPFLAKGLNITVQKLASFVQIS